jgi:uncharacterized membrane protein
MNNEENSNIVRRPNRIEALSDGVFGFAMTLLVVELVVPVIPKLRAAEELGGLLLELWPKFFAFIISFLVLSLLWFLHINQYRYIKRSNSVFTWINIILLMLVVLVPFSTALIGEYHIYSKIAVIFYGINGFLGMLMLNIIWWYATKNRRLVDKNIEPKTIKQFQIRTMVGTATFIPAIALSLVNPIISIAIYVFVILYGIISTIIWGGTDLRRSVKKF